MERFCGRDADLGTSHGGERSHVIGRPVPPHLRWIAEVGLDLRVDVDGNESVGLFDWPVTPYDTVGLFVDQDLIHPPVGVVRASGSDGSVVHGSMILVV